MANIKFGWNMSRCPTDISDSSLFSEQITRNLAQHRFQAQNEHAITLQYRLIHNRIY